MTKEEILNYNKRCAEFLGDGGMQKITPEIGMKHKNKNTGILDKNGIEIKNGDDVLLYHYNSYPKQPYKCKVAYKQGWILISADGTNQGQNYNVYNWRKAIEVIKTDNESIFITHSYQELKDDWFNRNVNWTITGEERKLLHKCFEEAFKLGQEQIWYEQNK